MMNWFRRNKGSDLDFEFVDVSRRAYTYHPVQQAKDVPGHFEQHQKKTYGSLRFAHCPGMIDYKNYGYIIPAWDDIHIMANKSGSMAIMGGPDTDKRQTNFPQPKFMGTDIGDGVLKPEGVPYEVIHIGCPWKIMPLNKQISVFAMPAFYHSDFLDDIYIYPGIVDYGKFCEINLICSPKRPCNVTIKAGTPLLHIIPFYGQHIKAGYGPASEHQCDKVKSHISTARQFYRKLARKDKPTTLEGNDK